MQAFQRNPRGPQNFNQDGNSDSAEVSENNRGIHDISFFNYYNVAV